MSHDHSSEAPEGRQNAVQMTRELRCPWLWTNFLCAALGLWLLTSPFTFGYLNPELAGADAARVTAERGLAPIAERGLWMTWNDLACGFLIFALALLALRPRFDTLGRWGVGFVGVWLQFAPLLLWAPHPAAYLNSTLVGALAITFAILVPMMPGMAHHLEMMKPGPVVPPGWTYNPASWQQRLPLAVTGLLGWLVSRYLAAYQLGYLPWAWDPFFGGGTVRVLDSEVSRAWPVSDAGLGAVVYTFEALMALMGGVYRWRTMPWMVLLFGILVIPLGVTHVVLVIMQPVMVGDWCALCLLAAAIMLVMIPLAVDEVVAMAQFMVRSVREGKPFWRTFWVGGTLEGETNEDTRTPVYGEPVTRHARAMVWGVSLPWTLVASSILGLWLMVAPDVLGAAGAAADSDRVAGALVITVAVCALAEVIRAARFLNVLVGLWLVAAPWFLGGATTLSAVNAVGIGLLVIALSLPRGPVNDRYGSWDRWVNWAPWPTRAGAGRRRASG